MSFVSSARAENNIVLCAFSDASRLSVLSLQVCSLIKIAGVELRKGKLLRLRLH